MLSRELIEQQFFGLIERYKCSDRYQMVCKSSPNSLVDQITILDLQSTASQSYAAAHPPESPRYWLTMFERALRKGTFNETNRAPE